MKLRYPAVWGIVTAVWLFAVAADREAVVSAEAANVRVAVGDGRVSFVPPAGFQAWTSEQIATKFQRGNRPQYVYANETGSVSVAITFSPARITPEQLPEFREAMEKLLPRTIPGLQWLTREFVTISGRRWLHLELTSHAVDTDIHNHIYATSLGGKALMFGFNSTIAAYADVQAELLQSAQSIRLDE